MVSKRRELRTVFVRTVFEQRRPGRWSWPQWYSSGAHFTSEFASRDFARSNFSMGSQVLQRLAGHLFLSAIRQQPGRLFQPQPLGASHLDPHFFRDIVDASRFVAQQIEADNL